VEIIEADHRIMAAQPGRDLADMLGIKPRNMLTRLGEWTRPVSSPRPEEEGTPFPEPSSPATATSSP
jgi:hypothetical protein